MSPLIEHTTETIRFQQNPNLRASLKVLLDNPVMVEALRALGTLAELREIPAPVPGNHPDTIIAHAFYHKVGVSKAISMLKVMASDPVRQMGDGGQEGEFEHNLPKDLQTRPPELTGHQ